VSDSELLVMPDYRDSTPQWGDVFPRPKGARDAVVIVLDDVGYGQLGCFGSSIETPNIDGLAADGLTFTNFHVTPICSPTRACLLTGRNHHANHVGAAGELATGFPGYDMRIPPENGTVAEVLRDEGYATYAVGKWHLAPPEEAAMGAPRDRWPLGKGFERFYGFLGCESDQYFPDLVSDNHQTSAPRMPQDGYHLSEDLADKAIEFVTDLTNSAPEKPFFLYLGLGACHTPHQAPADYIEKYRGKFDQGWDAWRSEVFRRQTESGLLPAGTKLSERPRWVPGWEELSDQEKQTAARLMEVYAGFLDHADQQIGRVIDGLKRLGRFDDTVIIVTSDNGASAEGGLRGTVANTRYLNGVPDTAGEIAAHLDELGGPNTYPHYPYAWAWAGNCPLKQWKQETHEGGIAVPMVLSWPNGIDDPGSRRRQFVHAIDVMPTLLDISSIEQPKTVRGVPQASIHGRSFQPAIVQASAPSPRRLQYFEARGCRALYYDGWKAVAYHPRIGASWDGSDPTRPFSDDRWELYNVENDFSETHDVAADHPERLSRMVVLWWVEAGRYNVLPLDNRGVARNSLPRPRLMPAQPEYRFHPSTAGLPERAVLNLRRQSYSLIAEVRLSSECDSGVLISQGSRFAGFSLYVKDRRLCYHYSYLALETYDIVSDVELPLGDVELAYHFTHFDDGSGLGELTVDGEKAGSLTINKTVPNTLGTGGDYLYIGRDGGSPVTSAYTAPFPFGNGLLSVRVRLLDPVGLDPDVLAAVDDARQ
jgi:arylsulfatase A-like enzyme